MEAPEGPMTEVTAAQYRALMRFTRELDGVRPNPPGMHVKERETIAYCQYRAELLARTIRSKELLHGRA